MTQHSRSWAHCGAPLSPKGLGFVVKQWDQPILITVFVNLFPPWQHPGEFLENFSLIKQRRGKKLIKCFISMVRTQCRCPLWDVN